MAFTRPIICGQALPLKDNAICNAKSVKIHSKVAPNLVTNDSFKSQKKNQVYNPMYTCLGISTTE